MRRAIRDEQKEERRQVILDVAWQLFQEQSYETVNMIDVANGAGLAKGTIYLYFKTKEELFLTILTQRFEEWFNVVDDRLQSLPQGSGILGVVKIIAGSLSERPSLTRLFAIAHVVLEKNIEYKAALAFKQILLSRITQTGRLLETQLPFLAVGQGAALLIQAYALVIGIQHLTDAAPVAQQVIAEPGMEVFRLEFEPAFSAVLQTLLTGMELRQNRDKLHPP